MGSPNWVLRQTVKNQTKCRIMLHFIRDLHCLLRLKQPSVTELHCNLENYTCDLFYTMDSSILIVSICMGKSMEFQIQRVKC